jgi:hypothetical protein
MAAVDQDKFGRLLSIIGYFFLAVALVAVCYLVVTSIGYGDDNEDPVGLCNRGYETHCEPTWREQMINRFEQWRIQTVINQTIDGLCQGNMTWLDKEFCDP